MSDNLKHECGIALVRLLKPLEYYKKKYGTALYGVHKMYLMLEKQHNRGQDGAGLASVKLDMQPGERYISRIRSNDAQPIQDIFRRINERINGLMKENPHLKDDVEAQKHLLPYIGEVLLGHVRYGTFGQNSIENVHPFLRQNNWIYRNLIVAGNDFQFRIKKNYFITGHVNLINTFDIHRLDYILKVGDISGGITAGYKSPFGQIKLNYSKAVNKGKGIFSVILGHWF